MHSTGFSARRGIPGFMDSSKFDSYLVSYCLARAFSVEQDFEEAPSQMLEYWCVK
jgi:hypothetical protein